jgi:hypothetical protein
MGRDTGHATTIGANCSTSANVATWAPAAGLICEFPSKLTRKMNCHSIVLARCQHRICNPRVELDRRGPTQ